MAPFIELVGASGATYRFRQVEGGLAPTGGNFVFVRDAEDGRRVVCCGKARTLLTQHLERTWRKDELGAAADQLYIRLNVVTALRDGEHEDLVAGLPRPFAIYEME
jgi:hypothetical protein